MGWRIGLAVLIPMLVAGCSPSQATLVKTSPSPHVDTFAGGCSGTVLTDAEPPVWAQGGWSVAKEAAWPVPWAFGTQHTFVAFLFSTRLVAGPSPRVDGSNNKVLWVTNGAPSAGNGDVLGHPLGQSDPVVIYAVGPSIVDLPLPGCWAFRPSWSTQGQADTTINLDVLPAGTPP